MLFIVNNDKTLEQSCLIYMYCSICSNRSYTYNYTTIKQNIWLKISSFVIVISNDHIIYYMYLQKSININCYRSCTCKLSIKPFYMLYIQYTSQEASMQPPHAYVNQFMHDCMDCMINLLITSKLIKDDKFYHIHVKFQCQCNQFIFRKHCKCQQLSLLTCNIYPGFT